MKWFGLNALTLILFTACSNSSDMETGEIKAIKTLREAFSARKMPNKILDTRTIVTRKKIDNAKVPVLFIELENKQNGTLTLYPGQNIGETWLGADGAIVVLDRGVLKATRGMRGDLMGATSTMPDWSQIKKSAKYKRSLVYLSGNNQTVNKKFTCELKTDGSRFSIIVFDLPISVKQYNEICSGDLNKITNIYFVDHKDIVRRSVQYHGNTLGYILIERLDR